MTGLREPHRLDIRVFYEDTDAAGIVYYANYLKFAERGRTEMLREAGFNHVDLAARHGVGFAVRHCAADYIKPARLDDLVTVSTWVRRVGGATIEMDQHVERDGEMLVRLAVRLACIDANGAPARAPAALRDGMRAFIAERDQP